MPSLARIADLARPVAAATAADAGAPRGSIRGGRAYDFCVVGGAAFLLTLAVLNVLFARELGRNRIAERDRAAVRAALSQWSERLARDERALDVECRAWRASLLARPTNAGRMAELDHIRELLKDSNVSLTAASKAIADDRPASFDDPPEPESAAAPAADRIRKLREKSEMLREEYARMAERMKPEHPTLRELRNELTTIHATLKEEQRLASEAEDTDSPVLAQPNRFYQPTSISTAPVVPKRVAPTAPPAAWTENMAEVEERFRELRTATEALLTKLNREPVEAQPADAATFEAVARRLRELETQCRTPPSLSALRGVASAPVAFSKYGLWLAVACGTAAGWAMIHGRGPRRSSRPFQHIGILSLEFHVDKLSRPLL